MTHYYGLIEVLFVFSAAIAFYIWQMRSLKRDMSNTRQNKKHKR